MDKNLFEKYNAELKEDLQLDDINLKDTQMKLPAIKHKWVSRLIEQKIERNKLKELRKEAIINLITKNKDKQIVTLSDRSLMLHAEQHEVVQKIDSKITDCDILIEYLEKAEQILKSSTFDIKNIIEIKRAELS